MTPLLKQLTGLVAQIDLGMTPLSRGFPEAVILLASVSVGVDEEQITAALDYDETFVLAAGRRLREAGIWTGKQDAPEEMTAEWTSEAGGVAFAMDVAVALGDMEVAGVTNGERTYRLTKQGRAHVARMLTEAEQ